MTSFADLVETVYVQGSYDVQRLTNPNSMVVSKRSSPVGSIAAVPVYAADHSLNESKKTLDRFAEFVNAFQFRNRMWGVPDPNPLIIIPADLPLDDRLASLLAYGEGFTCAPIAVEGLRTNVGRYDALMSRLSEKLQHSPLYKS